MLPHNNRFGALIQKAVEADKANDVELENVINVKLEGVAAETFEENSNTASEIN